MNLTGRSIFTEHKGYANCFDMSENYVNTLIVADFNLILCAIQGDIQRFELIEWFTKVRYLQLCTC